MNFFVLFPFLLINFCYFTNAEKASIPKCDSIMETKYEKDCKCLETDFPTCLKSLISAGKCTKETYPTNPIEKPCSKMYSKCSSAKNDCEVGICSCFDAVVDCLVQDKCATIKSSVKRVRASDTAFGFNNLFDAHFEKLNEAK
uniref:Uncharacterized protein n=1 Tax=Meloidogyne incognita TaxID=6306 RepID=A0A914M0U8_MELIC